METSFFSISFLVYLYLFFLYFFIFLQKKGLNRSSALDVCIGVPAIASLSVYFDNGFLQIIVGSALILFALYLTKELLAKIETIQKRILLSVFSIVCALFVEVCTTLFDLENQIKVLIYFSVFFMFGLFIQLFNPYNFERW